MPILCQQPSLFPAELLDGAFRREVACQWWVLQTRPRQEKAVARWLFGLEVPFFVPVVRHALAYPGRRVCSYVPLFPGYVFMFGSEQERYESLAANRIVRFLSVPDPQRLVDDLRRVHSLIESGLPLTQEIAMAPGRRVRIRGGALGGLEGTVIRRRGEARLLVSVDFLQRGASVQVDESALEPVD